MNIINLFDKPKIIGLIGNINEGKSNTLYYIIDELRKTKTFNLYTYGLRNEIPDTIEIYSISELEQIKNSLIVVDEVMTLWDLDNKMLKKQIENTLRLIHHNNNILILSAVPENIKKFISGKINVLILKKVTFEDFINGSSIKRTTMNYKGFENGSTVLNLAVNEAIIYDGLHYHKVEVPYLKEYDTKLNNEKIFKNVKQKVNEKVKENNSEKISDSETPKKEERAVSD